MNVIGLTGRIGSGKSEVAKILGQLGARIIDADVLAREAVKPGTPALAKLQSIFPAQYFNPDGTLNRAKLAATIFADAEEKLKLEAVVHPEVRRLFSAQLKIERDLNPAAMVVYAVPLLFQARSSYPELGKIIVVTASDQHCLERIMARDNCSAESAQRKMSAQLPNSEQQKRADYVVENDGNLEELTARVKSLHQELAKFN